MAEKIEPYRVYTKRVKLPEKKDARTEGKKLAAYAYGDFPSDLSDSAKKLARRIDAAVKRAAWDVYLNQPEESTLAWMEKKYGPRPRRST